MKKKNIHDGHRGRMRDKYKKLGFDAFNDHEVLEFLLYYCYKQGDTNERAHRMLNEFGTLHNLFETDVETLTATLNCSENIAVLLNLIPKIANRYFKSRWGTNIILHDEKIAGDYAIDVLSGETIEKLYAFYLDKQFNLINTVPITKGTINEINIFPREIVSEAIKNKATGVILAHNHPGGTMQPSRADNEMTRRIVEIADPLSIDIIDHIVVSGDKYYSYAARNKHVKGY
jgi:DNA repair protein RadC